MPICNSIKLWYHLITACWWNHWALLRLETLKQKTQAYVSAGTKHLSYFQAHLTWRSWPILCTKTMIKKKNLNHKLCLSWKQIIPKQNLNVTVNLLQSQRNHIKLFNLGTEAVHRHLGKWLHGSSFMPRSSAYFYWHSGLSGQDAKSSIISRGKGSQCFKRLGSNCCKFS